MGWIRIGKGVMNKSDKTSPTSLGDRSFTCSIVSGKES